MGPYRQAPPQERPKREPLARAVGRGAWRVARFLGRGMLGVCWLVGVLLAGALRGRR